MRILVLGSGGRESAIIASLMKSKEKHTLFALPGNGGIARMATCIPGSVTDMERVKSVAREQKIDFCIVTPDDPLAIGMVDALEKEGIACFGPDKKAARIESSKSFAKDLMHRYQIPTASYRVFSHYEEAKAYLRECAYPCVIKADGLALGKGVSICITEKEAEDTLYDMMCDHKFGASGDAVVIEEFLTGPEVSVLAFTDGTHLVPMVSSMDHKRAYDGNKGPNTGGMGTIAPNPFYTPEIAKECMEKIFMPTIHALKAEGCPFKGCLYFGLMLTPNGPKVIEYNSRFGDPETQVVLPLLDSDLLQIMQSVHDGTLDTLEIKWKREAAVCIVVASGGYPQTYKKGIPITITEDDEVQILIAGAKEENGILVTAGGRVANIVATAPTLSKAQAKCYAHIGAIQFAGMEYRHDIGAAALEVR